MRKIEFVFSDSYGTCRAAIKGFNQVVKVSSYIDLEYFVEQPLVPNGVESLTKIYETSTDFFLMVVDLLLY